MSNLGEIKATMKEGREKDNSLIIPCIRQCRIFFL